METSRPQIQHLLMTYTMELAVVLKSLIGVKLTRMPRASQSTTGVTWSELKEAFKAYEHLAPCRRIHHHISLIVQQDQQISDTDSFRCIFHELVKDAEVHMSVSAQATTSNPAQTDSVVCMFPTESEH